MIEGGEDVTIARRMLILSSEDIGANPTAFIMANNTFQAVATIGYKPNYFESMCSVSATSPKSNASYLAIGTAQQ
jgi:putative ATPase